MDQPRMAGATRLRAGFARAEVVDSRVRIRRLMFLLAAVLVVILARLGWLQLSEGPEFRRLAAQPIERHRRLDGVRGRILTRDGVVLAEDRPVLSVAVDYRWIADPPDAAWLRRVARQRLVRAKLPLAARKDPARLQIEIENVRDERLALQRRLAALCQCDAVTWESRLEAIRRKVSAAAADVNARRQAQFRAEQQRSAALAAQATSGWERFRAAAHRILFPVEAASPPPPIKIAEEVSDQIVAVGVPLDVVAEIEARPELYPATRIVQQSRRFYPGGMRAAHVVGHLGPATTDELRADHAEAISTGARLNPGDYVGRAGVEAHYDEQLRGRNGRERELSDLTGRVLSRECLEQPTAGRDLVLTIDARLQQTAETLLEAALARRDLVTGGQDNFPAAGGSIVALDVRTGAVLAAASAPAFDPGLFQPGGERLLPACLTDPRAPLLDRSIQMALPPGSVFKIVTAAALLEEGRVAPQRPFDCAGYFENPERERCAIFARYGEGHGPVTLETALVQSCNVYFFAQAGQ
ncbi:MAG: hypothetical protein JNG90_08200, partial [Planctomycetaceae bacterium]|nr:hypothetical protein [Planctomycetaceae bacterium]